MGSIYDMYVDLVFKSVGFLEGEFNNSIRGPKRSKEVSFLKLSDINFLEKIF